MVSTVPNYRLIKTLLIGLAVLNLVIIFIVGFSLYTSRQQVWIESGIIGLAVLVLASLTLIYYLVAALRGLQTSHTDLAQAQRLLRANEERLNFALDAAKLGWFDLDLLTGQASSNPEYSKILGYSPHEFNATYFDWVDSLHHDDLDVVLAKVDECKIHGGPFVVEYRRRTKDGSWIWMQSTGVIAQWGANLEALRMVGIQMDISERVQATLQIKTAQNLLEKLSQNVPGVIYQYRRFPDGRSCFPYASDGIRDIYEVTPAEVLEDATSVLAILHPDDLNMVAASVQESARTLQIWQLEYRVRLPVKGVRWLQGHAKPEKLDDGSILWHGFITDITVQKQAEETRILLENRLRESQKMEALGILAGGIAHDFNNILATILGNSMLAKHDLAARPEQTLVSLDEIDKATIRAQNLIEQILIFSRKSVQPLLVLPLSPLVEEVIKSLRSTFPASVVIFASYGDAPLFVCGVASQLMQLLTNLCDNARHAMSDDSGRIEIAVEEVLLDEAMAQTLGLASGQYASLRVSDDGGGMEVATQTHIFDPFFTTQGVGVGTGLGLSVVHGIVKSHGGAITVDSKVGKGTAFVVYLPATAAGAAPMIPAPIANETLFPARNMGRVKRVLYVDDDSGLVLLVQRMLQQLGYQVSGYETGEAAVDAVRANPNDFDLVISDYNMPGMSGLEVAKAVRQIRANLPVVIFSGYVTEELCLLALQAGAREVITKANTVDAMCQSMHRLLMTEPG